MLSLGVNVRGRQPTASERRNGGFVFDAVPEPSLLGAPRGRIANPFSGLRYGLSGILDDGRRLGEMHRRAPSLDTLPLAAHCDVADLRGGSQ
jgi:hypothetical protein